MPTELWLRNPHDYVRECVEANENWLAFDRGIIAKKAINPDVWADTYFGAGSNYRLLLIGGQGTMEIRSGHSMLNPFAVYPTWEYGENFSLLEDLLENPVGQNEELCNDKTIPLDERPIFGQEHRVVIIGWPAANLGPGRAFLRNLREIQEEYPEAIVHLHGAYSYRVAFGGGFAAADIEVRTTAAKGKVITPGGKEVLYERMSSDPASVAKVGMSPKDLEVPRNRCIYNIKTARWAADYFEELFRPKTRGTSTRLDLATPDRDYKPEEKKSPMKLGRGEEGDKFLCDTCSLALRCDYYRSGSVCSVPNAEPTPLSKYFGTRDAGQIIDGLQIVLQAGVRRFERGLRAEISDGETNPNVTRLQTSVFDQGVKLAKLLDPSLRGGGVQVNVGGGSAVQVNQGGDNNPRGAIAAAIRELEARGIPRESITQEMILGIFERMSNPEGTRKVIEGTVVEHREAEPEGFM